jgi:hypothetical protein
MLTPVFRPLSNTFFSAAALPPPSYRQTTRCWDSFTQISAGPVVGGEEAQLQRTRERERTKQ